MKRPNNDKRAEKVYRRLIQGMTENQGVTEQRKATDRTAWIRKRNSIQAFVKEAVKSRLIGA